MSTCTRITMSLAVASVLVAGLCGCQPAYKQAWRYAPSEQQAREWIARRHFVIEVLYDVAEPMPGTTYHGYPKDNLDGMKASMLRDDLEQSIYENIQLMGGRAETHYSGILEFDVTVSDELIAEGKAAATLHDYYARRLASAGWHIMAGGSSGIVPKRKWYMGLWTDLPGSHHRDGNSLSTNTGMSFPATARRGFFVVRIAVTLDEVSRKAHVTIDYTGKIGKPASHL